MAGVGDEQSLKADPFTAGLGSGRGLADPRALSARLSAAERELDQAHARLQTSLDWQEQHCGEKEQMDQRLNELQRQHQESTYELNICYRDRDIARYAAMHAGGNDPVPDAISFEEHHGVWTPGRPYLSDQHVYESKTGACYKARRGGARKGVRPGHSSRWTRCRSNLCPAPAPTRQIPRSIAGAPLRQSELWWDEHGVCRLDELPDERVEAVIGFLRAVVELLYDAEFASSELFVPCPTVAYGSPRAWLADTPLMRALLAERRRRQRRQLRYGRN